MNVYDWDGTIYKGDSTAGLIGYAYVHRPLTLLSLPRTLFFGLLYGLGIVEKITFKQNLYHMFVFIHDMEEFTDRYVDSHLDHVKQWYKEQQEKEDVVISASPFFLISRFGKRLGIQHVLASDVDMHTGIYQGANCHGAEKVRRFKEVFPDTPITAFYSDSRSDTPLAMLAEKAYLVKGEERTPWS